MCCESQRVVCSLRRSAGFFYAKSAQVTHLPGLSMSVSHLFTLCSRVPRSVVSVFGFRNVRRLVAAVKVVPLFFFFFFFRSCGCFNSIKMERIYVILMEMPCKINSITRTNMKSWGTILSPVRLRGGLFSQSPLSVPTLLRPSSSSSIKRPALFC